MAKNTSNDLGGEGHRSDEAASPETIIRQRARGLVDTIVEEGVGMDWKPRDVSLTS